jgi:hypothetical protein
MYTKKTYLLIRRLSPIELFQVLSNGKIDEGIFRKDVRSEWYLHNWEKTHIRFGSEVKYGGSVSHTTINVLRNCIRNGTGTKF